MASEITKARIIEAAIDLFNEMGFINVRLQHISDKTIISLGNITYHFKTKDDIINHICLKIIEEQKTLFANHKVLPLFEDVERFLFSYFNIQNRYPFFYQDILELIRAFPFVKESYRKHLFWQEQQILFMFDFNISRGVFRKEPGHDFYQNYAGFFLWNMDNWMHRQLTLGYNVNDYEEFSNKIWTLLVPLFTPQGHSEYEQLQELKKLQTYELPFNN